jgi:hypothetical protein
MSRKFYIISPSNGEIHPLKKWIRNNHETILGYTYSVSDTTDVTVQKLEKLNWKKHIPNPNEVIMIKNNKKSSKLISVDVNKTKINAIQDARDAKALKAKLKAQFNSRVKSGRNGFTSCDEYVTWYMAQPRKCTYCNVSEETVRSIVMTGKLKSARFPLNGVVTRGRSRGVNLEVDRWDSSKSYSKSNCRLACYFCNNDKSDVFDGKEYVKFFQNRKKYLDKLNNNKRK